MATIGSTALTLTDWAKRIDDNGKVADIIEILGKSNPILQDAMAVEGNLTTGHKTTIRTGLPTGTWRLLNYGVQPEKSTTKQVIDSCGMLEAYSEVDKALVALNGESSAFRTSEDIAYLEGMSQNIASTLFYGNTSVDPEKFMGLAPRFSLLAAENGQQILDAGGTSSDNSSIWLFPWSDRVVHLIFPKGGKSGLAHRDLGEETKILADGSMYQVLRSHFKWDIGLTVRDWRYVVRIANIDASDQNFASAAASPGNASYTGPNIISLLTRAMHKLYSVSAPGRLVIYCNRTVGTTLDMLAATKANVWLTVGEYAGQMTTMFRGIPIRQCDALLDTEARVI
jgi:hypothetical protein